MAHPTYQAGYNPSYKWINLTYPTYNQGFTRIRGMSQQGNIDHLLENHPFMCGKSWNQLVIQELKMMISPPKIGLEIVATCDNLQDRRT